MKRMMKRYFALLPAAGVGARMAANGPKQYLTVGGQPMLRHAVDAFRASPLVAHTYVVVSPEDGVIDSVLPPGLDGVTVLRCGGATRMDSVLNGLRALDGQLADGDMVMVHDAARPNIAHADLDHLIAAGLDGPDGALLAAPVRDTLKRADADGRRIIAGCFGNITERRRLDAARRCAEADGRSDGTGGNRILAEGRSIGRRGNRAIPASQGIEAGCSTGRRTRDVADLLG